ncbi:MAG: hypothetical protein ACQESR_14545 [Planctomycetota bacterium]
MTPLSGFCTLEQGDKVEDAGWKLGEAKGEDGVPVVEQCDVHASEPVGGDPALLTCYDGDRPSGFAA